MRTIGVSIFFSVLCYVFFVLPFFILPWLVNIKKVQWICFKRGYLSFDFGSYVSSKRASVELLNRGEYLKFGDDELNGLYQKLDRIRAGGCRSFFTWLPGLFIFWFSLLFFAGF